MISRSLISASRSRISASSAFASLVTDTIRLQNISARSSRARVLATWTMHANSRDPLQRRDLPHDVGVSSRGLPGEVGDLRLRDPLQPRPGIAERVDPSKVLHLLPKPGP